MMMYVVLEKYSFFKAYKKQNDLHMYTNLHIAKSPYVQERLVMLLVIQIATLLKAKAQ